MQRRQLFRSLPLALGASALASSRKATAAIPKMKITRVRYYHVGPAVRKVFNQSSHVVTVETDQGITGIGEGGHKDSIEQIAGLIIGENPSRIEHLWQLMYRGYFYPPGREKIHAQGAIDLALWDIKGKALGVPVYELLGGLTRDHVECYATAFPSKGSLKETAQACIEFGYRAFRFHGADPDNPPIYPHRQMVDKTFEQCRQIRDGVGDKGDWAIDFHTRFDYADAVRLCSLIEPLRPLFVEDLVRSENPEIYRTLRPAVKVPIAVGEHYGDRWDTNVLIENDLLDYTRVTLPNSGGITEYMKLAALCETHYVGLVPHFTGPIAEAALVHCIAAASGPALMEMRGLGDPRAPHLPEVYDFRKGKLYPRDKPGLGVEFDPSRANLVLEVTERGGGLRLHRRPDGSITNW
ncbi:MAG: mandelate racemase/muconate lactonizing enzyme family protein [bacterium]|nr:mandelate racemase/muconate lactonizing enzyme family protein [bacterium]